MNFKSHLFSKNWKILIIGVLIFTISAGILFLFKDNNAGKTFFLIISFAASFFSYNNKNNEKWEQVSKGILIGIATLLFSILVANTIKSMVSDTEWDFMCFYMQGQLGVHRLDFYDPNSFTILLNNNHFQHTYSDSFKAEILNVGLLSPPITMLFFAPLALVDYETSRIIISILIFIFIISNTILFNHIFLKENSSIYSGLFIFIIINLMPGTGETIFYNQTNFFLLFFSGSRTI